LALVIDAILNVKSIVCILLLKGIAPAMQSSMYISWNLTSATIKADGALLDNKVRAFADDTCQATTGRPAPLWHCLIHIDHAESARS